MSTTPLNLSAPAVKIIAADVAAFGRDGKRYAEYVTEAGVTVETVAAHVAAFRDAFKAAKPKADAAEVKAYATKVRNGLNYNLGKRAVKATPTALITSLGASADLESVIAAWHAAQK